MSEPARLAVYGTLAPGRENHHQLAGLNGRWAAGFVRGWLFDVGWGAAMGYPGIVLDPDGPEVVVQVLASPDLGAHWDRLDAFEGPGYRRVRASVRTGAGTMEAFVYALAYDPRTKG